jgi:ribonuclease-3
MTAPKRSRTSRGESLGDLIERLSGRRVADEALLRQAFTHASARNAEEADYQRLEFLGDRVLGLVVAELVHGRYPQASEGDLSLRLNALVRAETLSEIAEEIGLSPHIRASGSVAGAASRKALNLRADVMEALLAVLYLDGGLEAVRAFVARHWGGRLDGDVSSLRDAKTALQEWLHQALKAVPRYEIDDRSGPDHAPVFKVSVHVEGLEPTTGTGRSKREAEQAAATAMLKREGVLDDA